MKIAQPVLVFAIMITVAQPAFAYLDPGAGSFMLQMLIAGVMSTMFAIKMYWYRLKNTIARLLGKLPEEQDVENEKPDGETGSNKSASEKE